MAKKKEEIDEEVKRILQEAYQKAVDTITEHRNVLDRLAEELLDKEEVPGSKVVDWLKNGTDDKKEEEAKQQEDSDEQSKDKEKKKVGQKQTDQEE